MEKLKELREQFNAAVERMNAAADAVDAAQEPEEVEAAAASFDEAEAEVRRLDENVKSFERIAEARAEFKPLALPDNKKDLRVGQEEATYRKDRPEISFFRDLAEAKAGNPEALERLRRNNEERAISTAATAGGEFVPPKWLNDQFGRLLRAGRPFADQCIDMGPVTSMTVSLPRITTGGTAAVQANQGDAVSNTDQVTDSVTAATQTVAGKTVGSYQLAEFGQPNIDAVIYADLLADYNRKLDAALIDGNVTNAKGVLNVAGINALTYTDATPTVPELYPELMKAKSAIEKNAFVGVDFALLHPSVWNWYLSALDTANRPLAVATNGAAFNTLARHDVDVAEGAAGNLNGIPVIVDANVPTNKGAGTNEAPIALVNRLDLLLWETDPRFKIADQVSIGTLQMQYVLYGFYQALFDRYPKMISKITGTGTIVQAGF